MQTQLSRSSVARSPFAEAESAFFRSASNRDNRFRTARDLGRLSPSNLPRTFRASGFLGRRDRVDVIKFTTTAGVASSGGTGIFRVQRGFVRYTAFRDAGGTGIRRFGRFVVSQGNNSLVIEPFPKTSTRDVIYIVLDRPTRNTNYRLRFTYQP